MSDTLTFEKVWAIVQETNRGILESGKQIQELREQQKETSKQFQESGKQIQELREQQKETSKQFQESGKQFQESGKQFQESGKQIQELREQQKETSKQFQESGKQIQELREQIQETGKQIQELKEQQKETARLIRENSIEMKKSSKRVDKKLLELEGLFTGQWGKLIESLVEGDLIKLLKQRNISVERTHQRAKGKFNNKNYEIDIIAKNGKEVVFVEVKTTLYPYHVEYFLEKLKNIKEMFPEYSQNTIYGAVAYLRTESDSSIYAERQGLFVIRATGDSSSIINPPEFKPKSF